MSLKSRIAIVGIARNCQKTLRSEVKRLSQAFSAFETRSFFIVESDSTDHTRAVLEELSTSVPGFRSVSLGKLDTRIPQRTERLAFCRNRYLDELRGNSLYGSATYVAVADLDGVNSKIHRAAVDTCWKYDLAWGAMTANQSGPYYDIWALRHPVWNPGDCWAFRDKLVPVMGLDQANNVAVYSKMIRIPQTIAPIEVSSSFGGLAIYEREAFVEGEYVGRSEDGEPRCEHVAFHESMVRRGFRIFINPRMINSGRVPGHVRAPFDLHRLARDFAKYSLRKLELRV